LPVILRASLTRRAFIYTCKKACGCHASGLCFASPGGIVNVSLPIAGYRVLCMLRIVTVAVTLLCTASSPWGQLVRAEQGTKANAAGEPSKPKLDVGFVTTPQHVVELMVKLADLEPSDLVYDLGCGDGRIVVTAAKMRGCKAIGVDLDPERVEEAKANAKAAGVEDLVTIQQGDVLDLDLSDADVVMMYLVPKFTVKLIPQLKALKPGARIVAHDWALPGVEPEMEFTVNRRLDGENKIFLYEAPLRKVAAASEPTPVVAATGTEGAISFEQLLQLVSIAILLIVAIIWLTQRRHRSE